MAPDHLHVLLSDLRQRLDALYGDRLASLTLYGSHARGDAREDSDVDVLVVLRGDVNQLAEIRRMSRLSTELDLQHDVLLSLLPVAAEGVAHGAGSLARHAQRTGVAI